MAIECKLVRCEENDPLRCQAIAGKNQCHYTAEKAGSYCPLHSGSASRKRLEQKQEVEQYRLNTYQQRLRELSNHPKVKSLRDEIAILRMTLESVLQVCQTPSDLYLQHAKIAELAVKIEKLVSSCNNIEHKNGQLLDKSELLKMVDSILGILTRHIEDADTLRSISDEIIGLFGES